MARTTNSMALRLWDQLGDRYDNQQLSGNFAKIDAHDHTPGRGVPIPTAGIAAKAITPPLLSDSLTALITPVPLPTVSTLPGSPIDGQQCYFLADATSGVVWHLRYRSASASGYKWEYVGGPPMEVAGTSSPIQSTGSVASYTPLVGTPSLTLPVSGDYDVNVMTDISNPLAVTLDARVGLMLNGILFSVMGWLVSPNQFEAAQQHGVTKILAASVSSVLTLAIATNNQTATFNSLTTSRIMVRPVRVG